MKNIEIPWLVGWLAGWLTGWLRDSWGWKFHENHEIPRKSWKFQKKKSVEIP